VNDARAAGASSSASRAPARATERLKVGASS
jgi:hypothetical protein